MRFHSPDDLSPFGQGGISAYMYCGADPDNHRDPSGRFAVPFILPALFGIGAAAAGTLAATTDDKTAKVLFGVLAAGLAVGALAAFPVQGRTLFGHARNRLPRRPTAPAWGNTYNPPAKTLANLTPDELGKFLHEQRRNFVGRHDWGKYPPSYVTNTLGPPSLRGGSGVPGSIGSEGGVLRNATAQARDWARVPRRDLRLSGVERRQLKGSHWPSPSARDALYERYQRVRQ